MNGYEYSTTGHAGGYLTDNAPEAAHQPAQRLFGRYCDLVAYLLNRPSFANGMRFPLSCGTVGTERG
ncbi:MAG: hypothetical protein M1472_00835, partial [Planctomycetes bacterium]|nr:hypothetical protein [Planctomycetota bacterium]